MGLGNPGNQYARHRHNLGFMVLDELAGSLPWKITREKSLICEVKLEDETLILMKPLTFMNLSGKAVAPLMSRVNADPSRMIVVHDDLDLAQGRVRIKIGGGDGGHKGIRSIVDSLSFKDFIRVRIGIGRPPAGVTAEEYVLTAFEEDDVRKDLVQIGCRAVRLILEHGIEYAQQILHSEI